MTLFPQIGLQIQHNLYQNPNWLLCRNWQAGSTMSAEIQGLKQNKAGARTSQFQTLPQS